ncbi:MAG: TolC family protein [Kiritimatiellia bacterium]|nr:TolC family protein [Kiritimatiellia bacterium]
MPCRNNIEPEVRGRRTRWVALIALLLIGCVASHEGPVREAGRSQPVFLAPALPEPTPGERLTLEEARRLALARDPGLRAAEARWRAALDRIPQARARPDPELAGEVFQEQRDNRYQIGLTQPLPGFGKLRNRERQAVADAAIEGWKFAVQRNALMERVARAFVEYRYLEQSLDAAREAIRWMEEMERSVDAQFRAGSASLPDRLQIRNEREEAADRLASLEDQRHPLSAALASLLGLLPGEALPWPAPDEDPDFSPAANPMGLFSEPDPPDVQMAMARIDRAKAGQQGARREGRPDFMLGVRWMVMPGMEGQGDASDVSLMVGLSLPIWRGRIRAGIREAAASVEAENFEAEAVRIQRAADWNLAVFEYRDAERRFQRLAASLIPRAELALAAAREDYASGRSDFKALIEAQRDLWDYRLQAQRARADREIAAHTLARLTGLWNPDWADRSDRPDPPVPGEQP